MHIISLFDLILSCALNLFNTNDNFVLLKGYISTVGRSEMLKQEWLHILTDNIDKMKEIYIQYIYIYVWSKANLFLLESKFCMGKK